MARALSEYEKAKKIFAGYYFSLSLNGLDVKLLLQR
jgi:hypothetical protein